MSRLRWGICTAGKISFDFAAALSSSAVKHQLVAVAARDLERAKAFATKFDIPRSYGDYQQLAADPEVDIVYVGATMNAHYDLCSLFMNAGKHVLCEKSLTTSAAQAKKLAALSAEKRVFLMEAIWSRCFPLYKSLRELIDSGELGQIYGVESCLMIPYGDWFDQDAKLGGAMWDLGVYPLQLIDFVFQGTPTRVHASGRLFRSGADQAVVGTLDYAGGRFANFSAAWGIAHKSPSVIYSEKAKITIDEAWAPLKMTIEPIKGGAARTVEFEAPAALKHKTNYSSSEGLVYEADHVYDCITAGLLQSPLVPHSVSIRLQEIMDSCLRQVGRTDLPSEQSA